MCCSVSEKDCGFTDTWPPAASVRRSKRKLLSTSQYMSARKHTRKACQGVHEPIHRVYVWTCLPPRSIARNSPPLSIPVGRWNTYVGIIFIELKQIVWVPLIEWTMHENNSVHSVNEMYEHCVWIIASNTTHHLCSTSLLRPRSISACMPLISPCRSAVFSWNTASISDNDMAGRIRIHGNVAETSMSVEGFEVRVDQWNRWNKPPSSLFQNRITPATIYSQRIVKSERI